MTAAIEIIEARHAGDQTYLNVRMGGILIKGIRVSGGTIMYPQSVEIVSEGLAKRIRQVILLRRDSPPDVGKPSEPTPDPLLVPTQPALIEEPTAWSEKQRDQHIKKLAATFQPDEDTGF